MDKAKGIYCPCLESKLPRPSRQSVEPRYSNRIEDYWLREEFYHREIPEYEIVMRLRAFGIGEAHIELVMMRYIENMKMLDIMQKLGWVSLRSANYHLKETLGKLRKGGFSLR